MSLSPVNTKPSSFDSSSITTGEIRITPAPTIARFEVFERAMTPTTSSEPLKTVTPVSQEATSSKPMSFQESREQIESIMFKDPQKLLEAADQYTKTQDISDLNTLKTYRVGAYLIHNNNNDIPHDELLTKLLERYNGLCLGEMHSDIAPKAFLCKYMPLLVELGIDTLYLEGYSGRQAELDAYFSGESEELPKGLDSLFWDITSTQYFTYEEREELKKWHTDQRKITLSPKLLEKLIAFDPKNTNFYTERDVLITAKKCGIKRVVNIDTNGVYLTLATDRVKGMNFQAKEIIEKDMSTRKVGKYLIYAGDEHVANEVLQKTPSLGNMFKIPDILVQDAEKCPEYAPDKVYTFYTGHKGFISDLFIPMKASLKSKV